MQSQAIDPALAASLAHATELVEIRNASGHILGYFAPLALQPAAGYAEAAARLARTRLIAAGTGRTTAEVLAHLESLER